MSELREIAIAIARIILGMVVLIEGLTASVFIFYTSTIGGIYSDKVVAAYEDSYDNGYTQTYDVGYQEAYGEAYDRGYDKGYEIGLETGPKEGLVTRVKLRNPTHKEMREFLARDETDSNPYVVGEYVSFDFAVELNNNAELEGIRAAFVMVIFPEKRHGIVAFETIDKGLIFIEPQSDEEVKLVIGESYWRSIGGTRPTDYDDAVVEIQIIW